MNATPKGKPRRGSLLNKKTIGLMALAMAGVSLADAPKDFVPLLTPSPFEARLRLAEGRLRAYPSDSLDFIMQDLEHPKDSTRHAHQCTTDMTGRTLEFWAEARRFLPDLDPKPAEELFERILAKYDGDLRMTRKFLPYWHWKRDPRCHDAIVRDFAKWRAAVEAGKTATDAINNHFEVMALLWSEKPDPSLVALAKRIFKKILGDAGKHSHSYATVCRNMMQLARVTGDPSLAECVRAPYERLKTCEVADGSISEALPMSHRTEGCTIADWVMLNLRAWDVWGDEAALDRAEHVLVNALWFNQFVTGAFGHRTYLGAGYSCEVEEAWWCCTQTGGMALMEFARHAVQLKDGVIRINYLVPGIYRLKVPEGEIAVELKSDYPARYAATAKVTGAAGRRVVFRAPHYVKNAKTAERDGVWSLAGDIGHYAERRGGGWAMKYGPLMLAPLAYSFKDYGAISPDIPKGYVPPAVDANGLKLVEPEKKDANGFWVLRKGQSTLPDWPSFDDGRLSKTGTDFRAPAWVEVVDGQGKKRSLFFQPLCYQTSNLTLRDVPITFGAVEK